jgi:HEPN domain-containing protein
MEDKKIAIDAIESAQRWLQAAKLNAKIGNYDSALYSLEMSTEIALKAVLLALGIDIPKTHNIADVFAKSVSSDKKALKAFKGEIDVTIDVFRSLLELRNISGYIYETRYNMNALKDKYDLYIKSSEEIIEICQGFVKERK